MNVTGDPTPTPGWIHLCFRSGSRSNGSHAAGAFDYMTRRGSYDDPERDAVVHAESGHMPAWAVDDPRDFWKAADLFERANARLYVSADFALPRGLSAEDRLELTRAFVHDMTDEERFPYTFAIHAGLGPNGEEHNPHAHLMFSERGNDGLDRDRTLWFRQAHPREPEHGGTRKSTALHAHDWIERAREHWAGLINKMLEEHGRSDRVDHRSYERQGVDREPGIHYGPSALPTMLRGERHYLLEEALAVYERELERQEIVREITRLEALRAQILAASLADDSVDEPRDPSHSGRGDALDDKPSHER